MCKNTTALTKRLKQWKKMYKWNQFVPFNLYKDSGTVAANEIQYETHQMIQGRGGKLVSRNAGNGKGNPVSYALPGRPR